LDVISGSFSVDFLCKRWADYRYTRARVFPAVEETSSAFGHSCLRCIAGAKSALKRRKSMRYNLETEETPLATRILTKDRRKTKITEWQGFSCAYADSETIGRSISTQHIQRIDVQLHPTMSAASILSALEPDKHASRTAAKTARAKYFMIFMMKENLLELR
jgi:hypothetical protein